MSHLLYHNNSNRISFVINNSDHRVQIEEMCLSLEHQNPSKTSKEMGYFDRITISLHIL